VCPVVYDVVVSMGLRPALVDVSPETYNIDITNIEKTRLEDSRFIVPVHLFGKSCDVDETIEFAESHGLYVVEDAAQALGVEHRGRKIGSFGDVSILSFGLGKIITGGSGGALVINRDDLVEDAKNMMEELVIPKFQNRIKIARNIMAMKFLANPYLYSIIRNYVDSGLEETDRKMVKHIKTSLIKPNSNEYRPHRIHPLSAKIANYQLERIQEFNRRRVYNAKILSDILVNQSVAHTPSKEYFKNNVFCRFPIKLSKDVSYKRDLIVQKLLKLGIDAEKPYFVLKELLSAFKHVPNSMELVNTLINIPNHPCLSDNEVVSVGEATLSVLKSDF
jgi:dTDP-4-amino-4,6-dideoxygalactose transaminase